MTLEFCQNKHIETCLYRFIAFYSTAETLETAYVFGGQGIVSSIVAQYSDNQWKRLDDLNSQRYGHGSIVIGDRAMIIGGWARETET